MRPWLRFSFPLLLLLAPAAGCRSATGDADEPRIEDTEFAPSLGVDLSRSTRNASGLYWRDLTVGSGPTATAGARVQVHYTGWLANGAKFDENLPPRAPLAFTIGSGQVIAGFDEGVRGMQVGGARQLIIPPSLGYGPNPVGGIPGNSILVFRVELVAIQ